MAYNDIIGTIGVALILLAFFLNTARLLQPNGRFYYVMNIIGATMALYASYQIGYLPFVILEGAWMLVSIYGLMKNMKIKIN